MPKRNPTEFYENFTFFKTKKKGRTTVISFNWGRAWFTNRKKGLVRYDKTSVGGGKRDYMKVIELNDEEQPLKVMKKLFNIRKR